MAACGGPGRRQSAARDRSGKASDAAGGRQLEATGSAKCNPTACHSVIHSWQVIFPSTRPAFSHGAPTRCLMSKQTALTPMSRSKIGDTVSPLAFHSGYSAHRHSCLHTAVTRFIALRHTTRGSQASSRQRCRLSSATTSLLHRHASCGAFPGLVELGASPAVQRWAWRRPRSCPPPSGTPRCPGHSAGTRPQWRRRLLLHSPHCQLHPTPGMDERHAGQSLLPSLLMQRRAGSSAARPLPQGQTVFLCEGLVNGKQGP